MTIRTDPEALRRRQQARTAFALRMAGRRWREIAATVGYHSPQAAHAAVKRLEARADRRAVAGLRDLQRARLERLLRGSWLAATQGDARAALTCIRILDQLARLDGLYATTRPAVSRPTVKADVSGPEGKPIAGRVDVVTWTPDEAWLRESVRSARAAGDRSGATS